jgi:CBS domain-containing protein
MLVSDAMSAVVLTVGPHHTLRQTARLMTGKRVGSAIVVDPDGPGIGIITERDVLYAVGAGLDPDVERTGDHQTSEVVYASPDWTVADAARAMVRGGFRHLVVLDGDDVLGVISVRDVLRVWTEQQALAA